MTIIQTLSANELAKLLYKDDYATYGGSIAKSEFLADYLTDLYDDATLEFDRVAIRCDYSVADADELEDAEEHGGEIVAQKRGLAIIQW